MVPVHEEFEFQNTEPQSTGLGLSKSVCQKLKVQLGHNIQMPLHQGISHILILRQFQTHASVNYNLAPANLLVTVSHHQTT